MSYYDHVVTYPLNTVQLKEERDRVKEKETNIKNRDKTTTRNTD